MREQAAGLRPDAQIAGLTGGGADPAARRLTGARHAAAPAPDAAPLEEAPLAELLRRAKQLARAYYALTGRPLGVTGEVAEYEAVRLLGLELAPPRQPGYDVIRRPGAGRAASGDRLQVKGRCVPNGPAPGEMLGRIGLEHAWDGMLVVLLDARYDATAIYEAGREAVCAALAVPGSRARERGVLSVRKFVAVGRRVWPPNPPRDPSGAGSQ